MTEKPILGVLEVLSNGAGFLRRREASYLPSQDDIYVPQKLIARQGLRSGDEVAGGVEPPRDRGKGPALTGVVRVNGRPVDALRHRPDFTRLPATHPKEQLMLEIPPAGGRQDFTTRVIDLFCPLGKGQRALIVAPAKAGKTTVLQRIAEGVVKNYPQCALFILLVDERPEEITEMEMCGYGEVISSSFDFPADRHVAVAEITLERARRRVELGDDVVLVLDSITRLARAYNASEQGSGRTLSGGLDATSLEKPKRFLGSARSIDPSNGGGSLTIIATALVDTGSRMDQVIFEEFKGTGNSEIVLSRELAERRIYPAIDLTATSTRREELILPEDRLSVSHILRRQLSDLSAPDAMTNLLALMRRTETNAELVDQIKGRT